MKRLLLVFLCLCLPVVSAVVPADSAAPQVVSKPLVVVPGEEVLVSLYNGGHEVWSDLFVSVADGPLRPVPSLIGPEESLEVSLEVPLAFLLSLDEVEVSLWHDGEEVDSRVLPVVVDYPSELVLIDESAPGGPEFIVFVDPEGRDLGGVQVEVSLLRDGQSVYFDFFGPFYLGGDVLVYRSPLPEGFLGSGRFTVRGIFYDGNDVFGHSSVPVDLRSQGPSLWPLFLVFLAVLLVVFIYVVIDMTYYRKDFRESWRGLR